MECQKVAFHGVASCPPHNTTFGPLAQAHEPTSMVPLTDHLSALLAAAGGLPPCNYNPINSIKYQTLTRPFAGSDTQKETHMPIVGFPQKNIGINNQTSITGIGFSRTSKANILPMLNRFHHSHAIIGTVLPPLTIFNPAAALLTNVA